jgi:hypothetical protein
MVDGEKKSWRKIHPLVRLAASGIFVGWISVVALGGFAWPLGKTEWSRWPWNQSWFMFYRSSGNHYYLQLKGFLEDGSPAKVSLEDYFKYPSAYHSPRFNEIARDAPTVRQLGAFVCRKYNASAPAGARLARVTVWDSWWPDRRGPRRKVHDVPSKEMQTYTYLENETCDRLELERRS